MTSAKQAAKRAGLPRKSDYSREFAKDWDRLTHSGRFNMRQLKAVMMLLIGNDGPLPPELRDHALTADWADHRECHIGGDFLLIYQVSETGSRASIIFVRAGTHADLFE